jgi:hypothetical protein
MLLFGYQLRDVEISREALVGTHPVYGKDLTGHIHTATPRAFQDLMTYHGFRAVKLAGARPNPWMVPWIIRLIDQPLSLLPGLARRFFYLGMKL